MDLRTLPRFSTSVSYLSREGNIEDRNLKFPDHHLPCALATVIPIDSKKREGFRVSSKLLVVFISKQARS